MRYMLLVYSPEQAWTRDEWVACTIASTTVCQELQTQGSFLAAAPLHPVATAVCVRVRAGSPSITAGPFAETTEQLGGFFLIDVPDLDQAIAIAARLPAAHKGTVEIRPVFRLNTLPAERLEAPPAVGSTRYMLLCYDDEQTWSEAGPSALQAAQAEAVTLTHALSAQGQYVSASPLHRIATATSVRIAAGKLLISDGPFAETRECLGGYYLIDVRDVNEAIAIAAQHPGAQVGSVEIRRVVDLTSTAIV